jgi:hypothetical protein
MECDAVFAYIEESKLPDGKTLLELIDHTYLAFRDQAEELYRKSSGNVRQGSARSLQ